MEYLSYDIKGIQHFIYSVPKLKCMVGTSSQIHQFDRDLSTSIASECDAEKIFAGGGHGVFRCVKSRARELSEKLLRTAHSYGLDIRIGVSEDFSDALNNATHLYPYLPPENEMSGFPCSLSGLWPVGSKTQTVHSIIRKRMREAKKDQLGRTLLDAIDPNLIRSIVGTAQPEFFLNVHQDKFQDDEEETLELDRARAAAACCSLGNRNRWAIVAMDGNDVGRQFKQLTKTTDRGLLPQRIALVSRQLQNLTESSLVKALEKCLADWFKSNASDLRSFSYSDNDVRRFVLPIRPLICGGDDVVLLCHSSLAMQLVEAMCEEFEQGSLRMRNEIQRTSNFDPWPATGSLTMSAGILYSNTSLPLHIGIPYAQSLLASAKSRFRRGDVSDKPSPAAVDWEAVTDAVVDTPSARRRRELVFIDREIHSRIQLTRKPYLIFDKDNEQGALPSIPSLRSEFVEPLKRMPSSFRAELQYRLAQPWSERTLYLLSAAKIGSRHQLVKKLRQPGNGSPPSKGSAWVVPMVEIEGRKVPETHGGLMIQETGVIDAVLLLEEEGRMQNPGARS